MVKNFILAAIVGLGIAGLVFVSQNNANLLKKENKTAEKGTLNGNNLISNQPFVEKLTSNLTNKEENLTNLFASSLGKIIIENNPDGPANIDGKNGLVVPDPESIAIELLAEAAKKFDPSKLRPTIQEKDLKILEDNSKEALSNYVLNFQNIIKGEAPKVPKAIFGDPDNLTLEDISRLSLVYQEIVQKFYKLPVPKSALEIHKKEIELSGTKRNIFEKIKNYQTDPIATILATQELKKVDQEFAELDKKLSEFINNKL